MTSITPLKATDLLSLNSVNLDVLTENYHLGFYLQYLADWPTMFFKSTNPIGRCTGYMMGKSEGKGLEWHSHITAVTVDCDYRRLGIARDLVDHLVTCSEESSQDCYFMDLYVRSTNQLAIDMYKRFGFDVFRRVVAYYSTGEDIKDGEDAFGKWVKVNFMYANILDMRKPLKRDPNKKSLKKSAYTDESPHFVYKYNAEALK